MSSEELKVKAPFGKIKLTIEYDGSNYCGWQRQGVGIPSIQQVLEDSLKEIFKIPITLIGAGRTDSGVHAENQVAHFIAPRETSTFNFIQLFQSMLPPDITVKKTEFVPANFHAQRSALGKTYTYRIWNEPVASALRAKRSLWIRKPLNIERLNQACELILGTQDFNCFRSEGSAIKSTVRTVNSARFEKVGDYVEFRITGNGFLKQMVRNIVGTFLQIDLNQREVSSIPDLIKTRDRTQAGPTVQPQGLYLTEVQYP